MTLPLAMRRLLGATVRRTLYTFSSQPPAGTVRVLAYHSIDDSGSTLSVSRQEFRSHLEVLQREGWRTLSMPEYIRRLDEKQPSAGREILITFDDAYSNFYELAAPLLSDFGFTATIFVPTDFIAERPRWFERDRAAIIPFLRGFGFNTDDLTAIEHMTESVTQRPLMTAPQMQELRAAGFDFHSHSAAHAFLPSLPTEVLTADLDRSARCLADLFGPYRLVLCYPYGASDERVHTAARKAGFVAGFGATYHARLQDRFNIARVGVAGGLGLFHFRFGLSSALDSYAALR